MKPAIFNTDMVRAIFDDRKTNTRRPFSKYIKKVIKYACLLGEIGSNGIDRPFDDGDINYLLDFAPYKKGDIIYVRETHSVPYLSKVHYRADNDGFVPKYGWTPSIHMPKEYARLFLRVKDVRIERLNEISEEDAKSEGMITPNPEHNFVWEPDGRCKYCNQCYQAVLYSASSNQEAKEPCKAIHKLMFKRLWESIYGKGSFNDDYVWVIEFEKITKEEAINERPTS